MPTVYILGVDHFKTQLPHPTNDQASVEKYRYRLEEIIREEGIQLVAEEVSKDALEYQGISETYAAQVATEIGIAYLPCDPGLQERQILGIKQRQQIADDLGLIFPPVSNADERRINDAAAEYDKKREGFWLDKIKAADKSPVLLVCGFEHVGSTFDLATHAGYETQIMTP